MNQQRKEEFSKKRGEDKVGGMPRLGSCETRPGFRVNNGKGTAARPVPSGSMVLFGSFGSWEF